MTCDFCVNWSLAQWELFAKKRSYKERKKSRHSGSVPPAPGASPRAGTPSGVLQPGTSSSSFSGPSGGQDKRGGGLRVHLVLCPVRLPPLPLGLGLARGGGGGSVSGHSSVARERASVSSVHSGAGEGEVARSQQAPPARAASSVASPRSSPLARRCGELREVSEDRSRVRSSRGSRSLDRGARKDRRARSRLDSSRDRGCRSHSSYRSQSRGRERRRRSSSRSLSSCERSRSSDRSRSHSRGDRSRSSDRYWSCRDQSRSSNCYRSRRQRARSPARRGACGHAISFVVLVTARGLVDDFLPPLTVRGQWRKDGEPEESSRRVKGERTASQTRAAGGCGDGDCLPGSCCL